MHLQAEILSQPQKKSNPSMKEVLPSFTAKAIETLAAPAGPEPLKLLPEHFRNSTAGVSGGEICAKVKSDP